MNKINVDEFVNRVHKDIPLTKNMGWNIDNIEEHLLSASAPLQPNINDKGTLFGGASAALLTISSWSLIKYWLETFGLSNDVVVFKSQNSWNKPHKNGINIHCEFEQEIDWDAVKKRVIDQNKTQHLKVLSECKDGSIVTSSMNAGFVILPFK